MPILAIPDGSRLSFAVVDPLNREAADIVFGRERMKSLYVRSGTLVELGWVPCTADDIIRMVSPVESYYDDDYVYRRHVLTQCCNVVVHRPGEMRMLGGGKRKVEKVVKGTVQTLSSEQRTVYQRGECRYDASVLSSIHPVEVQLRVDVIAVPPVNDILLLQARTPNEEWPIDAAQLTERLGKHNGLPHEERCKPLHYTVAQYNAKVRGVLLGSDEDATLDYFENAKGPLLFVDVVKCESGLFPYCKCKHRDIRGERDCYWEATDDDIRSYNAHVCLSDALSIVG